MLQAVPSEVQHGVKLLLGERASTLKDFSFVGGGCINQCGKLTTRDGNFFLKWNEIDRFKLMFEVEAFGLQLLREPNIISVPQIIGSGEAHPYQFLVLEFMEHGTPSKNYWEDFGRQLAKLHGVRRDLFGLDRDNYMGSLPQANLQGDSWSSFFVAQRLQPQVSRALNAGLLDKRLVQQFEQLYQRLPTLLPEETPSLLHGDLWRGNLITNASGDPCLIDPAVYYGNREVDLAMTRLFGGFDDAFYGAYDEVFPLLPDHAKRTDLYNLYPLLVHLNLFGTSYLASIQRTLFRFA